LTDDLEERCAGENPDGTPNVLRTGRLDELLEKLSSIFADELLHVRARKERRVLVHLAGKIRNDLHDGQARTVAVRQRSGSMQGSPTAGERHPDQQDVLESLHVRNSTSATPSAGSGPEFVEPDSLDACQESPASQKRIV
jgi:hypothetical protein